jgi:3-deoxy-D-manno-octulosonate 8-phosphate phosphatase (KDO 8-P phosphatase)
MGYKKHLHKVKALIFDVDGVLSISHIPLFPDGERVRYVNTKDSYALNLASKKGLILIIITGGDSKVLQKHFSRIGFAEIHYNVYRKIEKLNEIIQRHKLDTSEILYMGDDIPDYEVMKVVGVPVCPSDAVPEIKKIAVYKTKQVGGQGCVREVVEHVLKAKGFWMCDETAFS